MAFENAYHCNDYVSEKMWRNAFGSRQIPIVFGPHMDDVKGTGFLTALCLNKNSKFSTKKQNFSKNRNFSQEKTKEIFVKKNEIFVKNRNLRQESSFSSENEIFVKNQNIC